MPTQALLKRELSIYFNHPAICTVTFFRGSISVAETHFQSRFKHVLQANPWLGGKLVMSGNEQKLIYSSETQLNDVLSVITTAIAISPETEYEILIKTCSPYSLGGDGNLNGHKLLKAGAPVCRLVVAPTEQPSQFIVLFSLSHAIADGYTYYEILNMLTDSASVNVRALNPQRKMEYQQLLPTLISPPILKFGSSLTFLKAYLMGMFRKPSSTAMAYYVDEVKVQEAKKICTTGFISTNDILTSHYMNACAPVRLGMMTINYRPRCSILNNNDAGNYEEIVLSDKGGYKTPENVRMSLKPNDQGSFVGITSPLPGFFSKCPLAFISSWAIKGTDRPFDLEFAEQQLHLPVLFLGVPIAKCPMDMALVFRPAPKKLAVLYIAKQCTPVKLLGSGSSVLGESLNKNMFPVSDKENQVTQSKKVTPL